MWARVLHIWSNIRYVLCVKPVATNGSVIDRIAPLSLPISPCPMGPKNHVILQTILTPCFSLFSLLLSLHFISTNPTATRESTGNILISSCHFHRKYVRRLTYRYFLTSLIYSANHPGVLQLLYLAMIDLSEILPWYQIIYRLASMFENSCAA